MNRESISLLQLNIWQGVYIDRIIDTVKKGSFDILHFQEVSGGNLSSGGGYNNPYHSVPMSSPVDSEKVGIDCFKALQEALPEYNGILETCWTQTTDPSSYFGNATFIKKSLGIKEKKEIRHDDHQENLEDKKGVKLEDLPRKSLAIKISVNNKDIWLINTHLAWGPTPEDADYKTKSAKYLANFVENLSEPFVLTGDFNVKPDTQLIEMFDKVGVNLVKKFEVKNTLNPRVHKAKQLFPPGIAVDYIFVHPDLAYSEFKRLDEDLSDHFGLSVKIEV